MLFLRFEILMPVTDALPSMYFDPSAPADEPAAETNEPRRATDTALG